MSETMLEYMALTADSAEGLGALVNVAIGEGWRPLGGVSVTGEPSDDRPLSSRLVFAQALTREGDPGFPP